jgi:60 kDa SS-A/Ro ribonucleoprotein
MANPSLFKSIAGKLIPKTDALNEENAPAYAFSARHALAQYAATGCLNATFYASAEEQLSKVLSLCSEVEPEFIAKTAVFCRERGFMKDMPALLCAILSTKDGERLQRVFPRICNDGRMVRNFVQIIRSGVVGRKSLGTVPKRLVQRWLEHGSDEALFRASVGQNPSLADVIKMVHPKPETASREALYGYLVGSGYNAEALPGIVKEFEAFKVDASAPRAPNALERQAIPDVPFQMLTALNLGRKEWVAIARRAPWQMTRINLNTFARHGVFEEPGLTEVIARQLRDREAIKRARVFPHQLLAAYSMTAKAVPTPVRDALQDAMEIAIENVPSIKGKVYVCLDVSGSMQASATGYRKGATSVMRCVDVAALVAAALVRKNPATEVIPFEQQVVHIDLNSRDSVMTNAAKLAAVGGGGTNCSAPLAFLNAKRMRGDLVVFISDNESWVDARPGGRGTATMQEWQRFKKRNPTAKLVCIDLQPNSTTQATEREDILNIGGFSDQVFELIATFAEGINAARWVDVIEAVEL